MSDYQDAVTDEIISALRKDGLYNLVESTYETEHSIGNLYGMGRRRVDIALNLVDKYGNKKEVFIEIKNNVADLKSGYGMNLCSDYNFLAFQAGRANGPIRWKHIQSLPEYVGILVILPLATAPSGYKLYCLREAVPKNTPIYLRKNFGLQIGDSANNYVYDAFL